MSNTNRLKERLAEAARYALLRRLAPAIRHSMGGALQPISMVVALLEKTFASAGARFGRAWQKLQQH